jgi:hypothetical protein
MRIWVRMLAFHETGTIREVEIPDGVIAEHVLSAVFAHGQNDVQSVAGRCSVSVGDVIDYGGRHYIVAPVGFRELSRGELASYEATARGERFGFYDRLFQTAEVSNV